MSSTAGPDIAPSLRLVRAKPRHQIPAAMRSHTRARPFYQDQHARSLRFVQQMRDLFKNTLRWRYPSHALYPPPHRRAVAAAALSRCLYRETAPSPLTPPLKLMSAAKFSSLANRLRLRHRHRHRHQPCCLAPTTILTGPGSSKARGWPPSPPGWCGVAGWERGTEPQPPAAPLRGGLWVAALAALTRLGLGGSQV